ncbi:MAG: AAA domain-containing protein [Bacteroidales bacterium]|nr:AAA domain-containing protein [Bacteroidales bacterium]
MSWWSEFKEKLKPGTVKDLVVTHKAPPGFIFFKLNNKVQGSLHVSELNWNFGLCQIDFRNIQVSSILRVYVNGFDDKYHKVILGRKLLPDIEKPSMSPEWESLKLENEISGTVFELFRNKVIILLENNLFAYFPLLENKTYEIGEKIKVIPIRKVSTQNIIECTLREIELSTSNQASDVIKTFEVQTSERAFANSESCLNSYSLLSISLYWNYFSKEEQDTLKILFEETESLFSKVEKSHDPIFIEFDFSSNLYNEFLNLIAPTIFDPAKLPSNFTEKDLLIELSNLRFWYTQFEVPRMSEGQNQNIVETLFSFFNEVLSIRGKITEEGILKITNIKAKTKGESLKDKLTALKKNDIFFIDRPLIFTQYTPGSNNNSAFIHAIDNKITAFKFFEIAKKKSLDTLEQQGKDFRIFSNFLKSQISYEGKSADDSEILMSDCQLEIDIQVDGIAFRGKVSTPHVFQLDDKIIISITNENEESHNQGLGVIKSIKNGQIVIQSNVCNFDLLKDGCLIKKLSSIKQYVVQLEVLKSFFSNSLPIDTFYKLFHNNSIYEAPEMPVIEFINPLLASQENPQSIAVRKAVGNKNIVLIQGPPGTGKTSVIAEIVNQLVKRGQKILVTSQTHIAVDNVLEHIKDDKRINIARIGNQDIVSDFAVPYLIDESRKIFSEKIIKIIDIKIELITHHINSHDISEFSQNSFELPLTFDWKHIEEFILMVQKSSAEQSSLLIDTLEKWKEVVVKAPVLLSALFMKNLDVVFGTCIGIATNKLFSESDLVFDAVILDEAGKANISETLTAISRSKKIILVGDHKQLPPYLDSDRVEYFKTYLKDVLDLKVSDPEIKQALGASFFEYLQRDGVLSDDNKILLAVQHRMHPDIGNFISQAFYDSELQNGKRTHDNYIILPPPFDKQIIFIDTSSDKASYETLKDGSYFNVVEAELIVGNIIPELERNNINHKSYAIVSPYRKQCEKIKELLSENYTNSFDSLEVATLDSFQGREYDIIILSFTRSSVDKTVGFLDDARRLNVALSRAKKKLILIGNVETLKSDRSHYDKYYSKLFANLWKYAAKYGNALRINELDLHRLQSNIQEGNIINGIVRRFESYGAFIDIGTKVGLIHISDLSWGKVYHPSDILQINQQIQVKILRVDNVDNKIYLGLKQLQTDPWRRIKLKKEDNITGKVVHILNNGVIIEIEPGVDGILYFSNIEIVCHNTISDFFEIGQEITASIVSIDKNKKKLSLKMNNWESFTLCYKENDLVDGIITEILNVNITSIKVLIELANKVEGYLYASNKIKNVKIGKSIKVAISKIDMKKQIVKCKFKI